MKKLVLVLCVLFSNFCIASPATEIIAEILVDLNHFPTDLDIEFLDEIVADNASTEDEKALARIVGRIKHKPEAEDVSSLIRLSRSDTIEIRQLAEAVLSIDHKVADSERAVLEKMLGE